MCPKSAMWLIQVTSIVYLAYMHMSVVYMEILIYHLVFVIILSDTSVRMYVSINLYLSEGFLQVELFVRQWILLKVAVGTN